MPNVKTVYNRQLVPYWFYSLSVKTRSVSATEDTLITNAHILPQVNGDFAVDLFGELVRAYLASTNTRSQVTLYRLMAANAAKVSQYHHRSSATILTLVSTVNGRRAGRLVHMTPYLTITPSL